MTLYPELMCPGCGCRDFIEVRQGMNRPSILACIACHMRMQLNIVSEMTPEWLAEQEREC